MLVSAQDLADWANRLDAAVMLPALMRRLVHETCEGISEADFPALESTRLGGWDGTSAVQRGNAWVSAGKAGWELGVERKIKGKADDDYDKRTAEVEVGDKADLAFMFVTPRVWRGRNSSEGRTGWLKVRNPADGWREVRVIDGESLAQWIETAPATQAWLAERLGKAGTGHASLEATWERWTGVTEPRLPPSVFSDAIELTATSFRAWLDNPPLRPFVVAADRRDEAEALAAALVADDRFAGNGDTAVVVSTAEALLTSRQYRPHSAP